MLTTSRGALIGRGVAFLVALGLVIALACAQFAGVFADRVTVTALLTETGDALTTGSDVKLRGVLVGRVQNIDREPGRPGAVVELRLEPGRVAAIPAAVTARSLPANFFGQAFVDLVPPAEAGEPIRGGARIPADTSAETVELQDTFANLFRVLSAVEPAKLATVLGALAQALDGRGAAIADLVRRTDTYLRGLRPALPDLRANLTAFADFAENLGRQAPSLLDSVDDVLVLARTLVERQEQFLALLGGGLGLTTNAETLLEDNEARLVRVSRQTRQIIGAFGRNPTAFSDGFVDLGAFLGELALGADGRVGLDTVLRPADLPSYTAANCPRYPGLAGPNCGSAAAGAALPVYGGIGPVGSAADKLMLAQVLGSVGGADGSGDVGMLLAGSLLRGQTVLLPAETS